MNIEQLEQEIVEPTLRRLPNPYDLRQSCYSKKSLKLVTSTIIHESDRGEYVRQVGGGPALGICQMEPKTFFDHQNYIDTRKKFSGWKELWKAIRANVIGRRYPDPEELRWNNGLAVAMCRLHYLRAPAELPAVEIDSLAEYWFDYYNRSPKEVRDERITSFKCSIKNSNYLEA